jgi:hypothetical protein
LAGYPVVILSEVAAPLFSDQQLVRGHEVEARFLPPMLFGESLFDLDFGRTLSFSNRRLAQSQRI